ncbi:MAG: hypothetical protein QM758_00020 [Armatimonas sp.]
MRFLLTLVLGLFFALTAFAQTTQRALRPTTYSRGVMALELAGVTVGSVRSVAGGAIYGEVVPERLGPDRVIRKHLGAVRFEPITIEIGLDMAPAFLGLVAHVARFAQYKTANGCDSIC